MEWTQIYDPLGSAWASTGVAAIPIVLILVTLGLWEWPAPRSASVGLLAALAIAIGVYDMPLSMATTAAWYGALFGLFPIGWIVVAAIFLYALTLEAGHFEIVKQSVVRLSADRRLQALLIAFSFGAFVEGAAGFGTPVAISAALMIGTGFRPLHAAGLALIANTAPVAFGALGTPIITLADVTGLPEDALSAMAGRQLPFFSLLIPAWLVWVMSGWRGVVGVWPAILVSGGSFAIVQFFVANYFGPRLVDVAGGIASLVALASFLRIWQPATTWDFPESQANSEHSAQASRSVPPTNVQPPTATQLTGQQIASAWTPWALLSLCVFLWGLPSFRTFLDGGQPPAAHTVPSGTEPSVDTLPWWQRPNRLQGITNLHLPLPALHRRVFRDVPVVPQRGEAEPAVWKFHWLSATGTGIFVAALLSACWMRISPRRTCHIFVTTVFQMRWPLFTIAVMLAIAYTTRFSGVDATLGLAFTRTGRLYPFFAAMLGWLGVALTGSDTSSNALFGSLQTVTGDGLVRQGILPLDSESAKILLASANSTGGVMGKMIDAQSIVVSAAATQQPGGEGPILRFVFWHSVVLAALMGLLVMAQAYWWTWMIPHP